MSTTTIIESKTKEKNISLKTPVYIIILTCFMNMRALIDVFSFFSLHAVIINDACHVYDEKEVSPMYFYKLVCFFLVIMRRGRTMHQ